MLKFIAILAIGSLLSACVVVDDNGRHRGRGHQRPHASPRVDRHRPPPMPPRHVIKRHDDRGPARGHRR